jgi:hypothetical protein
MKKKHFIFIIQKIIKIKTHKNKKIKKLKVFKKKTKT